MQLKFIEIKFEKPVNGLCDFYQRDHFTGEDDGMLQIKSIDLIEYKNMVFIRDENGCCLRINLDNPNIVYIRYERYDREKEMIKKARMKEFMRCMYG